MGSSGSAGTRCTRCGTHRPAPCTHLGGYSCCMPPVGCSNHGRLALLAQFAHRADSLAIYPVHHESLAQAGHLGYLLEHLAHLGYPVHLAQTAPHEHLACSHRGRRIGQGRRGRCISYSGVARNDLVSLCKLRCCCCCLRSTIDLLGQRWRPRACCSCSIGCSHGAPGGYSRTPWVGGRTPESCRSCCGCGCTRCACSSTATRISAASSCCSRSRCGHSRCCFSTCTPRSTEAQPSCQLFLPSSRLRACWRTRTRSPGIAPGQWTRLAPLQHRANLIRTASSLQQIHQDTLWRTTLHKLPSRKIHEYYDKVETAVNQKGTKSLAPLWLVEAVTVNSSFFSSSQLVLSQFLYPLCSLVLLVHRLRILCLQPWAFTRRISRRLSKIEKDSLTTELFDFFLSFFFAFRAAHGHLQIRSLQWKKNKLSHSDNIPQLFTAWNLIAHCCSPTRPAEPLATTT